MKQEPEPPEQIQEPPEQIQEPPEQIQEPPEQIQEPPEQIQEIIFENFDQNIPKINFTIFSEIDKYFDWKYYIGKYKDLRENGILNETYALRHWNIYGKKEKRISSKIHELIS
jgi:hypothetical protein